MQDFSAEQPRIPLEGCAAVDIDNGQHAADAARLFAVETVKAVIGGVQPELGPDITPAAAELPFDAGIHDQAAAVLTAVVAEAGKLCGYADLRAACIFTPLGRKARHEGIRFVFIAVLVGQRLEFLCRQSDVQNAASRLAAVIQPYLPVEVDVAGYFFAAVKVAVVAAVGNPVEIYACLGCFGNLMLMLPFRLITVAHTAFFVVRQPGQVGLSAVIRPQVAELSVKYRAPRADYAGGQGGIEIGGKVEIIGDGKGNAV